MPTPALHTVHPARPGTRPFTAEDLWAVPRVGAPAPAPDGRRVAVAVSTPDVAANLQRGRIWLLDLVERGDPRPLTALEHSASSPAWSPDGKRLAFLRKAAGAADGRGGGGRGAPERPQAFLLPLAGGEAERLSDLPLGVLDLAWLPDGSGLVLAAQLLAGHLSPEATRAEAARRADDPVKAHVTEERFFRYWDTWITTGEVVHLFHLDLATRRLTDLTPAALHWFDWMEPAGHFDVSPDGREVVYGATWFDAQRSRLRGGVWRVALAGGGPTNLTADAPAGCGRPRWSPDGASVFYGRAEDPDFYADRLRIWRYERGTGEHRPWLTDWDRSPVDWQVEPDGSLLLTAEHLGRQGLFRARPGGTPEPLVAEGWVSGVRRLPDGRLSFNHQSLTQPPELATAAADGSGLQRLTRFTEAALAGVALGEVLETTFEGAGGAPVQAFVVLPPGSAAGPRPLLQVVHGGPHGVSGDAFGFRWNAHLFAAPGYVVMQVNFQGSTGWGNDFAQRIQGAWGDRPTGDVLRGTDALVATGLVDPQRLALAGGSYGGYLAAWVAAHTDRFRCIVNHAGVYDTLAHWACDVTQGRHRAFGGQPWDGLEAIDRWNPARFTQGMRTPMLVIHGDQDYRVPGTQGLACYNVLKAKGVPARLVYFPDEGHWILKPRNSLLWYREVHAWLARFLAVPAAAR